MKQKFKILLTIAASLCISSVASNTVFIAATPYVNKPFLAQVVRSPGVVFQSTRDYIAAIGKGREGVSEYQQARIAQYVADESAGKTDTGTGATQAVLPPPQNPEDFRARGYTEIGQDTYQKRDVSANTIEIYFGKNAKFEKRTIVSDGQTVEAWVPL
jgi:hypothetical protein